jgi:hypothetical protein
MKRISLSLLFLSLTLICQSAFATHYTETQNYWVIYSLPGDFWGKTISEVYIHGGVLQESNPCSSATKYQWWTDETYADMRNMGDHFFTKLKFTTKTEECGPFILGPVVEYIVYFKDGTVTSLPAIRISAEPVSVGRFDPSRFENFESQLDFEFAQIVDADRTSALLQKWGIGD